MFCGAPDQLPASLLDLNWDQRMASLCSILPPSPSSSSPASDESVAFRKLVGRSQTIRNSDEMPPQSGRLGAHLNSPPELDLSVTGHLHQHQLRGGLSMSGNPIPRMYFEFSAVPGFAEAAASRFSMFDGHGRLAAQLGVLGTQNGWPEGRMQIPAPAGLKLDINSDSLVNSREESSVSDPAKVESSNAKKRKAAPNGKGKSTGSDTSAMDHSKATEQEDLDAKRYCSMEKNGTENDEVKSKVETKNDGCSSNRNGGHKQDKESTTAKPPEPPKDYIHVRARRGQATDSHSLAERVRREKISQRMKLLQDLVPGCNKITGKAVMLDEIINYVQSLQRQVEFLSMKLATVNPHLDFNSLANLLYKMHQNCGTKPNSAYSLEASGVAPNADQPQQRTLLHCLLPNGMETQSSRNQPDSAFYRSLDTHQPFLAGYEGASTQLGNLWEDDLHNVHMDIGQN